MCVFYSLNLECFLNMILLHTSLSRFRRYHCIKEVESFPFENEQVEVLFRRYHCFKEVCFPFESEQVEVFRKVMKKMSQSLAGEGNTLALLVAMQ